MQCAVSVPRRISAEKKTGWAYWKEGGRAYPWSIAVHAADTQEVAEADAMGDMQMLSQTWVEYSRAGVCTVQVHSICAR